MDILTKLRDFLGANGRLFPKLEETEHLTHSVLNLHTQITKKKPPIASGTLCPICLKPHKDGANVYFYDVFCPRCIEAIDKCKPVRVSKTEMYMLSWGVYGGHLKEAIYFIKYSGMEITETYQNRPGSLNALPRKIARIANRRLVGAAVDEFALALAKLWWKDYELNKVSPNSIVVPVPLAHKRLQERGYNQAALLAKSFAWYAQLKYEENGLKRVKETPPLYNLNRQERQQVMSGVFMLGDTFIKNKHQSPIILVDDIYTTGTTVNAARQVFEQNGMRLAGMVTLAATALQRKNQYQKAGEMVPRRCAIAIVGSEGVINPNGLFNALNDLIGELSFSVEVLVRDGGVGADVLAAQIADQRGLETNALLPNQIITLAQIIFFFAKASDPDPELRTLVANVKAANKQGKIFREKPDGSWY